MLLERHNIQRKDRIQMTDFSKFENQFTTHEVGVNKQNTWGNMAVNDFGRPEAMFVYGNATEATATEFTVDIDMSEVRKDVPESGRGGMYQPANYGVDIVGGTVPLP